MAIQTGKKSDLGRQAVALAEQLGRITGTLEGRAEMWLNRQSLAEQLTRVRDGAAEMLATLSQGVEKVHEAGAKRKPAGRMSAGARRGDPARAPGKRRRKPGPTLHGVKKSDERIPKMRSAAAARQRRKSYA